MKNKKDETFEDEITETTKPQTNRRRKIKDNDPVGPLLLITAGIILLLNNFGVIPWKIWDRIWQFWPVLLVLWGIRIILGRSFTANIIMAILTTLVFLIIAAYAAGSVIPAFDTWLRSAFPFLNQLQLPFR